MYQVGHVISAATILAHCPSSQNISLRRPEVEDGVARYASPTPRSKGFGHNTMRLDDREMLLIAILALWRADVATYFLGLEGSDSSFLDYFAGGKMVRDDGNEYVVRLAMSRSFNFLLDTAFVMQPGDPFVEQTTVVLPNLTCVFALHTPRETSHQMADRATSSLRAVTC
jgi:hypothetical protein